jgi:DNA mismatch endonuclease (patch repair protein)
MLKLGAIPPASSAATHNVMVANRGKDTRLELRLREALKRDGMSRFVTHYLIGSVRVDLAFVEERVAVQVYGCFWHHCPKCNLGIPETHRQYWRKKFEINRARDRRASAIIRKEGWKLVELWEHEIEKDSVKSVIRVERAFESAQLARTKDNRSPTGQNL